MRHPVRFKVLHAISIAAALALIAAATSLPVWAADADPAMDEAVAELVRELDAPQKARREAAEQKLIALGPKVVDRLPKTTPTMPAEVESRLNRVRMALYRARAESSVAASTVTLKVKDAPLNEIFAAIEKQTGNHLIDFRRQFGQQPGPIKLTLDVEKKPFWKVVDEISSQANLKVYHFAGDDGLAFVATPSAAELQIDPKQAAAALRKSVSYSEAFRIEARRVTVSLSPAAADSEPGELRVELEVAWEPRLKPLFLTSKMNKVEATAGDGGRILPGNRELSTEIPPQGKSCRAEVTLGFHAPAREVQSIKKLQGTLEVLLPAELHTFRFTKLDEAGKQEQRAAAVTVTIDEPRKNNDIVQIALTLKYDNPANALESHRAWFYKNPCYLEAADGTKTPPGTIELSRQSNDDLMLNLLFAPEADGLKQTLVYQTPADIVVLPVTYEFNDLPLP